MGADNQAQRVIDRLERQQMAQETAKLGTTLQIVKTAKEMRIRAALRLREEEQQRLRTQMGD